MSVPHSWIRVGLLALAVGALAAPAALGVSGSDTITTSAGTGTAGFVGEGGQATSAQLSYPWGVAIAGENVYVVDNIHQPDPEGERRDHHDDCGYGDAGLFG